ncbi:sodium-dependent transporter [Methanoculleus sp. FWC-SCC1]|uniref:Transporter n=1 Tax=Methanoculleus frigidifontis TaxID=2584085 RepID=A0ABT8M788_9EURY|nr:sodium-dependent transporter [Methanoculleus sp. FWC-SCC1]MDN7023801.1 sodium-dependent transporter [Methanoculleus sp. FWC-SCC1]
MVREQWSSWTGFILASIGSAVGIGNIWRFPYIVGQNGGGAFLIPYLISVFLFALPLMMLELAIGRHLQTSVGPAFRAIGERFFPVGILIVATISLILSYYLVIASWVFAYTLFFALNRPVDFTAFTNSYYPLVFFLITGLTVFATVRSGVREGIERLSRYLIPVLVAILLLLVAYALTTPGALAGIAFYLAPDTSRLADPLVWAAAFGQAFFSLSVGMGILLTYGSYLGRTDIFRSASVITVADILIALLAGLIIFPLVFSFGLDPAAGVNLAFVTLPSAFAGIPFGAVLGVLFFAMLFVAALTSAVSMLEVPVATIIDSYGYSRRRATLLVFCAVILLGLPSALSYTALRLELFGTPLLDLGDYIFGTLGLIVAGLLVSTVAGWFMNPAWIFDEIGGSRRMQRAFLFLIRYAIPLVLLAALLAQIVRSAG